MYAGKACVVSDVGGLPDVIRDGLNGLMFRSEDEAGLSESLARLMSDPQLRHRLGAAAIEAAHLEFSEQQYLRHFAMFALGTIRASGRQDVPLLKPPGDG